MGSQQSTPSGLRPASESLNTASSSPSPPSYEEIAKDQTQATDTPKYEWNNSECRDWIYAVLVEKCERSRAYAEKANQFYGCGPNLWIKDWTAWWKLLGDDGYAVYIFLLKAYKTEMRPNATVKHFETSDWDELGNFEVRFVKENRECGQLREIVA